MEPGEDPLAITSETFRATPGNFSVLIECWDSTRNLARRVKSIKLEKPGRLELEVERFGKKAGALTLADLARASNHYVERRGERRKYRERFRESLERQFPDWRVVDVSAEQDLHHSFSPVYPRALLRKGTTALAAIGAPEDATAPEAALSFGLIWLDYLRRREKRVSIEGLALFVPAGREQALCHRVRFLNPRAARYLVFVQDGNTYEQQIDPGDYTNLETRLDVASEERPRFSARTKSRMPNREAMLESRIRGNIQEIDATLRAEPVYGQVPQFAGVDRGFMDLLAVDHDGLLAVLELKVDQDIHLPLQALDYWMRVKWHLDKGDFAARGFFPGIALRAEPPRLLLVAPALEFHPTNEAILKFFAPEICVERLGIGIEWLRELKVVFRPGPFRNS